MDYDRTTSYLSIDEPGVFFIPPFNPARPGNRRDAILITRSVTRDAPEMKFVQS